MQYSNTQAIIFDLGGVILCVDYQRTARAFEALGLKNFNEMYSQFNQSSLFDELETGKIDPDYFVRKLQKLITGASREEIISAWNAIILDFPMGRLEFLKDLASRIPCFLLSNTNQIHADYFTGLLNVNYGIASINDLFIKAYLSHEIKMRKPNPEVFKLILNEQNLKAENTLFIDDSHMHIASAQKLGMKTLLLKSISNLEKELVPFLA